MKSIDDIKDLFYKKQVVSVNEVEPIVTFERPIKKPKIDNEMTPVSKSIYDELTSDIERIKFKKLIKKDNEEIENIIEEQDNEDPDYLEKLANNALGLFMEDYICRYGKCLVCGQKTLKKYVDPRMPVIDLVCDNDHWDNIHFFQVKISLGTDYFNLKPKKVITVGSLNYGKPVHELQANNKNKTLLPGYICLKLNEKDDTRYTINNHESFCLIPDLTANDGIYYSYVRGHMIHGYLRNGLTWTDLVKEFKMSFDHYEVDPYEQFSYGEPEFPQFKGKNLFESNTGGGYGYYHKYSKYKIKYLKLKRRIE